MVDQLNYQYDLFVSHAKPDHAWVHGYLLPALGLSPERVITPDDFTLGAPYVSEFERAVTASHYTVLILSPDYLRDEWATFSEQLASHASAADGRNRLIPLTLNACVLPLHIDFRVRLDCTAEANWRNEVDRLRNLLSRPAPHPENIPCPYPGMVAFTRTNADHFYGRDDEIEEIVHRLRHQRSLFIIGASGAGKSSLINAGALTRLATTSLFPPSYWLVREVDVIGQPVQTLALVLGGMTELSRRVDILLAANPPAQRLLIFVDRFEALFSQADLEEQRRFVAAIQELRHTPSCVLLVAMRAAFYQELMATDLWPVDPSERLELVPLRGDALRQAVRQPACDVGVYLEPLLLERLLSDASNEPGVLPLMQETMVLLWDKLSRRLLTLDAYDRLGRDGRTGLTVAIATKADAAMAQLSPPQQVVARRVLLRLVQFGQGRPDTRRQQSWGTLRSVGEDVKDFDRVVDHLIDNRLLVSSGQQRAEDDRIDIAHEALISSWPTLQVWLSERRSAEQTRRRFEEKAEEWVRLGSSTGGLLDAVELAEANRWLDGQDASDLGYSENVKLLIETSRATLTEAEREKEVSRQRELDQQRALTEEQKRRAEEQKERAEQQAQEAKRFRRLAWAFGVVTAVALVVAGFASWQRAKASARELVSASVLGEGTDAELAVLLAAQAVATTWPWGHSVLPEAERQLHRSILASRVRLTLGGHGTAVVSVAWSPDGKRLVTGSADNTATVWDTETCKEMLKLSGHSDRVVSVAWSPDGKGLATGRYDRTAKLWDAETGKELLTLRGHENSVTSVAWSPDGKRLATGSRDNTAKVWDVRAGKERLTLGGHKDSVWSVNWSPDGQLLATASADNTAKVWDTETGKELVTLRGHKEGVTGVAWSPDGKRLATASADNTAEVWDTGTGKQLVTLRGHSDPVLSVAWSPDRKRLATGSYDRTAKVWDATTGKELLALCGHGNSVTGVTSVAWSPDGKWLATGGYDTATVCDTTIGKELVTLSGHEKAVSSVAWSPDGKRLATGSRDYTAKVWDAATGKELLALRGHGNGIASVAWSPDGKRLATGSYDHTAKLWDAATGKELLTLPGHKEGVTGVAWSPDGKRLATGSQDMTAKVWDAATGKELLTLRGHGSPNFVLAPVYVAWSPDGKRLATGSGDNTAKVWDAATGKELLSLRGHGNGVESVTWSPDGKRLATGGGDNTAKVWDAAMGKELLTFRGHWNGVESVAWSPDGKRLATGSYDRTGRVWDATTGKELLTLTGHSDFVLSVAWSSDGKRLATASADGKVQVYAMDIGDLMALARQRVTAGLSEESCKQYFQVDKCPPVPQLSLW